MSLGVLICVSSASRTATRAMRNAQTYPNDTSRADQCSDLISPACRVRCDSWKDTALRPSRLAPSLAVLLQAELTHTPCARQSRCLTNAASAGPAHATAWFVTTAAPRPNEPPPPSPPPSPATSSARSPPTPRDAMPVVLSDAHASGTKIPACPWCPGGGGSAASTARDRPRFSPDFFGQGGSCRLRGFPADPRCRRRRATR